MIFIVLMMIFPLGYTLWNSFSGWSLTAADTLTGAVARHPTRPEAAIINTAGRNRMLCARLIKLFLFAEWGIRPETTSSLMVTSRTEFQNNLALLRHAAAHSPQALAQLTIDDNFLVAKRLTLGPLLDMAAASAGARLAQRTGWNWNLL